MVRLFESQPRERIAGKKLPVGEAVRLLYTPV